jgi:iron complex transport system substrate-binding protein
MGGPPRLGAALPTAVLFLSLLLPPPVAPRWAAAAELSDAVGRRVRVPAAVNRIVSLAPGVTEMLFAVGAGDRVVGVTDWCDFPPEAAGREKVGGLVNPSLERIASLRPDLVVATADGNRAADVLLLERMNIAVWVIDTRSLEDVWRSMLEIGRLTGREAAAVPLVDESRARVAALTLRVMGLPRPTVLFLVGLEPPVAAGPGTFIDDLIAAAGGRNVMAESPVRYPLVGAEALLALDPDAVVVDSVEGAGDESSLARRPYLARLRAVRQGRVHRLRSDAVLRPGPRAVDGLEALIEILHPPYPKAGSP